MKKIISLLIVLVLVLSFTSFASNFVIESTSVPEGSSAVSAKEGTIILTFNDNVSFASILTTNVTKNGTDLTMADFDVNLNGLDAKKVDISFFSDLEYGATYVIDFSGYTNESQTAVSGTSTLTFTVETAPVVDLKSKTLISGVGTATITNPTNFVANDTLQGLSLELENKADAAKVVTVVLGLFDVNGLLKKMITTEKSIAATSTDTVGIGTIIPSVTDTSVSYAGGKAKAYIWDNLTNKSPYVGSVEYDIVTP